MSDALDKFFDQLENMIDAQDDMWIEEQNANIKWRDKIKQERYEPAKKAARAAFEEAVQDVVKHMLRNRKDVSNINKQEMERIWNEEPVGFLERTLLTK